MPFRVLQGTIGDMTMYLWKMIKEHKQGKTMEKILVF